MPDAQIGHGTQFERGNGADPEVFATIGDVRSIDAPSIKKDIIDATHMQSPGAYREYIVGLKDAGEVSCEIQFKAGNPAVAGLIADCEADEPVNYRITWPDTTVWGFAGLATGFEPTSTVDGIMTATFTVKVTGRPDFAGA